MRLKINKINSVAELHKYKVLQEVIDQKDNYIMYKISRDITSNPLGILYHCMFYLDCGKTTPQDIAVNSESDIIEKITLFISKSNKNRISLVDFSIEDKMSSCGLELNECTADWKGRYYKLVKGSRLMWEEDENYVFFIFSDSSKQLIMYHISNNFNILVDKNEDIQGFCLVKL